MTQQTRESLARCFLLILFVLALAALAVWAEHMGERMRPVERLPTATVGGPPHEQ